MATIPGSQFTVTAPFQAVNIVETNGSGSLPAGAPFDFNLEVFVGSFGNAPSGPAPGYQGLAVLSPNGTQLDLVSGVYAVTDNGSGDTLSAYGNAETVTGSSAGTVLNLFGTGDVAQGGGGPDTISLYGNAEIADGVGNEQISVYGLADTVNPGGGNDLITLGNTAEFVNAGTGADTITGFGEWDTVDVGSGHDTVSITGQYNQVDAGSGSDTINVAGSYDTVTSGATAGTGANATITLNGTNMTLVDGASTYADTVVGFEHAVGDTINLSDSGHTVASSGLVNGNQDTLITLNDGSTILLKGVTSTTGIFS
jgi:RTX calcium-binding nonapeptide repeat (4 copies)